MSHIFVKTKAFSQSGNLIRSHFPQMHNLMHQGLHLACWEPGHHSDILGAVYQMLVQNPSLPHSPW
jgi:hypothetical protein